MSRPRRYNSLRERVVRDSKACCLKGFEEQQRHLTNESAAAVFSVSARTIQTWRTLARDPDNWCCDHLRRLGLAVLQTSQEPDPDEVLVLRKPLPRRDS